MKRHCCELRFACYKIDLSSNNLVGCRLIYYCSLLFDCLSSFYLILASIDRVLVTSPNALLRQRSTRRLAFVCLLSGTLFWMLFHSHTLFLIDIQELVSGYFVCYFRAGLYENRVGYYSTFIKGILMSFLLIIFGIWTWKNLRNVHRHRVIHSRSTNGNLVSHQENSVLLKNRQFTLMLLIEILIYIAFNSMLSIIGIYQQFATDESQARFTFFIRIIGSFVTYIPLVGNFFISKTFRSEVKRIFLCK
ncbi:hypothetical protein I4U23_015701 [Adineta vaga]|nr:hypothetical protein I4U23_015701 [Adineta vaga]